MERYANVVVAVIALLCCLQPFSEAKSLKTQLEIDERQLLNVLPSWLERLRNNLPSSLTGRVKPLVLFELMSIKYFLATNYFITHICRVVCLFFFVECVTGCVNPETGRGFELALDWVGRRPNHRRGCWRKIKPRYSTPRKCQMGWRVRFKTSL